MKRRCTPPAKAAIRHLPQDTSSWVAWATVPLCSKGVLSARWRCSLVRTWFCAAKESTVLATNARDSPWPAPSPRRAQYADAQRGDSLGREGQGSRGEEILTPGPSSLRPPLGCRGHVDCLRRRTLRHAHARGRGTRLRSFTPTRRSVRPFCALGIVRRRC
jgi:hypothetical protein